MGGVLWIILSSIFAEHNGHGINCNLAEKLADRLNLLCQWVMAPAPARVLVLLGILLFAYSAIAATARYVFRSFRRISSN